jgi:hypothetical protein
VEKMVTIIQELQNEPKRKKLNMDEKIEKVRNLLINSLENTSAPDFPIAFKNLTTTTEMIKEIRNLCNSIKKDQRQQFFKSILIGRYLIQLKKKMNKTKFKTVLKVNKTQTNTFFKVK